MFLTSGGLCRASWGAVELLAARTGLEQQGLRGGDGAGGLRSPVWGAPAAPSSSRTEMHSWERM